MTRPSPRTLRTLLVVATLATAVSGCGGGSGPATTTASSAATGARVTGGASGLVPLSARPVVEIDAGGRTLRVAAADDEQAWEQGLMGVTHLGSLDGMLFRFHATVERVFWMKDTAIALDIAFVDAAGRVLSVLTMPVCAADPCPTYRAPAPYAMALEAPAGRLAYLRAGDRLTVTGPAAS